MLESGAIQARGGTLPGRMLRARSRCRNTKAAAVQRHVHGIGIQIGSYPCRTHDKRNRPRLWVKPRWRVSTGFQFFHFTLQGRASARSRRRARGPGPPLCRDIGRDMSYSMIG